MLEDIIKWFWWLFRLIEWVNIMNILCDCEFGCIFGVFESESYEIYKLIIVIEI